MRYAIYTAVSTVAQASPEKVSLEEQQRLCRQRAAAKGWRETSGPFIVPGESRTRWVNLRDAEENIPALKHMLTAAQQGQFDILILYDYTRLRELLDPVAKTLSAYGVQIYSISQPVDPIPPQEFDVNETASTLQFVAGFTSRAEIAALRRRYKLGMPRRVAQKGLPTHKPPYGYRKPPGREFDRNAVPVQNPLTAPIVLRIKDLFLAGRSLWQIAHALTAERIPTPAGKPKWSDVNVRLILKQRFYCGEVSFGRTRRIVDPRTGEVTTAPNPPSRIVTARGAHTPLWDMTTQARIDDEFQKRGRKYTGIRTQRLSNLLYCGICGARCWVTYPGGYADSRRRWVCSQDPKHVNRKDTDLLPALAIDLPALLDQFAPPAYTPRDQRPHRPARLSDGPDQQSALQELLARSQKNYEAFEAGARDLGDYIQRKDQLDALIQTTRNRIAEDTAASQRAAQRLAAIRDFRSILHKIPRYIATAPAQDVNTQLRAIIQKIIITPNTIKIELIP